MGFGVKTKADRKAMRRSIAVFSPRWSAAFLIAACALAPARVGGAPAFVLDGRCDRLQALVLAEDEGGPVTALDVLFYADMARRPTGEALIEDWLAEGDEREARPWGEIVEATERYLAIRALARQGSPPAIEPRLRRAMMHTAAEATWIDRVVKPLVIVMSTDVHRYYIAHQDEYLKNPRAQVRYIYFHVNDMSRLDEQREAEDRLNELRARIESGELSFEEAARQFSGARSRIHGGLIPAFERGTHFAEFEFWTFALDTTREMSPVFVSNDGAYLIQLVALIAPERVPLADIEPEIRSTLLHEHVRSYYRLFSQRLARDRYIENYAPLWDYVELDVSIARVGEAVLERDDLLALYPSAVNMNFVAQDSVILSGTGAWIEGEVVMADLERLGMADSPYLTQAGRIADELLAAQARLKSAVPPESFASVEAALESLSRGKLELSGVPQARVVRISIAPDQAALTDLARLQLVNRNMLDLAETISTGYMPIGAQPAEFALALSEAANQSEAAFDAAFERLADRVERTQWTDLEIQIEDVGWKDALGPIAWRPSLVGLDAGEVSSPEPIGAQLDLYYAAQTRIDEKSPWLERPLAIQTAAFEAEKQRLLGEEVKRIRSMNLLTFEVEEPAVK